MALVPSGSGSAPVIAEVEMNGGADQSSTTVRATVVQASTVFYDTPATLEPGNDGVYVRRWKRITYSREFLLAVGSSEACKAPPAGVDMSKHQDDATLWSSEAASSACSFRAEPWRARSAGSQGDLPQRARGQEQQDETCKIGVRTSSKPCTKFFSTTGCSFGKNCHFIHNFPGGYQAAAKVSVLQDDPAPVRARAVPDGPPTPTVKPARPCHSAHDETELGIGIGKQHMSTDNSTSPLMEKSAGHHAPQPPNPGTATSAPVNFGASATAKISVDASLAGAIIGRDGANMKQISRASGAKVRILDHETEPGLKNLELEGTLDQIKNASSMVMGMLIAVGGGGAPLPAGGSLHGGEQQRSSLKTKLCGHFVRGSCTFGDRCHFAHGESELRIRDNELDLRLKNLELEASLDQIKDPSGTVTAMLIPGGHAPPRTVGGQRNSFKTKLCGAFTRGSCTFGDGCRFAHGESELRIWDPDLGLKNTELEGMLNKIKGNGSMAAGMLLVPGGGNSPPPAGGPLHAGGQCNSFKTKPCGHFARGSCAFGDGCRFAHGESELRIGDGHLSEPRLKNLQLGRAFDQIRDASSMGMLIRVGAGGDAPSRAEGSIRDGRQRHSFKAKLCDHFVRGSCIFGDQCHFAHGEGELRKLTFAAARDPYGW